MKYTHVLCTFVLSSYIFYLAGCGFELRTFRLSDHVGSVSISSQNLPEISQRLRHVLRDHGIDVDESGVADVGIEIKDQVVEKMASVTTPRSGIIEYELVLTVRFTLAFANVDDDPQEFKIIESQRVNVHTDKLLATATEERVVRRELLDRAVEKLLQILDLAVRERDREN